MNNILLLQKQIKEARSLFYKMETWLEYFECEINKFEKDSVFHLIEFSKSFRPVYLKC